jgi:hypothetical protein
MAVDQLPHALVAVQGGQVTEHRAREGQRVASAVAVGAGGQRRVAAPRQQGLDVGHADAGLVAEHEHEHIAALVDVVERRRDRGRAARAVVGVLHDLGRAQVHPAADLGRGAPDDAQQLVKRAAARGLEHVPQQRRTAIGQQLLGLPQPGGAAGGEHQPADPAIRAARRSHDGWAARSSACSAA